VRSAIRDIGRRVHPLESDTGEPFGNLPQPLGYLLVERSPCGQDPSGVAAYLSWTVRSVETPADNLRRCCGVQGWQCSACGRLPDPTYEEQSATRQETLVSQPRPSDLKIRRRHARVYRHAQEVQPTRPSPAIELKREQEISQLGLGVGRPGAIALLALEVAEMDPALSMGQGCSL
jgi:hypothetical protein